MRRPTTRRPARRRRGCLSRLLLLALLALIALNGLAWMQARAMTHFVREAPPLETLISAPLATKLRVLATGVEWPRPQNRQVPSDHYLPYEVRQIPLPHDEVLEAWFVPHPQSRGIVLMFPGYAGAKDGLLTPAAHMFRFGFSSLLVDFRGSGGSSRDDTTVGMREADDVAAAVAYAHEQWGGQPLVLYGVSMGSAAILRAIALNGVRPAAIIIEGSFDRLLTTVEHRFDSAGLPAFPAAQLLVFWGSVQFGYNGFSHNPVEYASAVECPALLLNGERDPWVTPAEANAVFERLRGPKQIVTMPGLGHAMPFVYWAPDQWVAVVGGFLAEAI